MGRPKNKTDKSEAIYLALRHAIIEQALPPGAKLPEDAIAEQFSSSRTAVRHALGRLRLDGLVEFRHNRGAAVAKPSWEEASMMFEIRMSLERIVTDRLAGTLSKEQIAELKAHVQEEIAARGAGESKSIRLATEFHLLLAKMVGSEVLAQWVNQVALRCGLILALYARPHSSECGINEHEEIISALERGDRAEAVKLMEHHLGAVIDRALIVDNRPKSRDFREILSAYATPRNEKATPPKEG